MHHTRQEPTDYGLVSHNYLPDRPFLHIQLPGCYE